MADEIVMLKVGIEGDREALNRLGNLDDLVTKLNKTRFGFR